MITLEDVISLTCELFEISRTQVAKSLNFDKSSLTRMQKGDQSISNEFISRYYANIFDPSSSICRTQMYPTVAMLLYCLEETIKNSFASIKQCMEKFWVKDPLTLSEDEALKKYKNFVLAILHFAILTEQSKSSAAATKRKRQSKKKTAQVPQSNDNLVEIIPLDCDKIREIVNRSADQFLDK